MKRLWIGIVAALMAFVLAFSACGGSNGGSNGGSGNITPSESSGDTPGGNSGGSGSGSGSGSGGGSSVVGTYEFKTEKPDYSDCNERFMIAAFGEPALKDDMFREAQELGVTRMYIDPWHNGTNVRRANNPDYPVKIDDDHFARVRDGIDVWTANKEMFDAFELCDKYGMEAFLMIFQVETSNGGVEHRDWYSWRVYDAAFKKYYADQGKVFDWNELKGFGGFVIDEPVSETFAGILNEYRDFRSVCPDKQYFVNMMGSDTIYTNQDEFFKYYVNNMLGKTDEGDRIFSIDAYPYDYNTKTEMYRIADSMVTNTELAAHYAKESGSVFYAYLQTWGIHPTRRLPETIEDMRWQIGFNMAFGAKGFEMFTYNQFLNDGFYGSVVEMSGKKTDMYYLCKQAYDEIRAFEKVYLSFDWVGAFAYDSDAASANPDNVKQMAYSLDGHKAIKNYSAQRDLIIGAFRDKNGYDGFLLSSYNDPYYQKTNNVRIEFNGASRAVCYINGEEKDLNLAGGVFEYEMQAGDIVFIIPLK